jgi:hypothetical protein
MGALGAPWGNHRRKVAEYPLWAIFCLCQRQDKWQATIDTNKRIIQTCIIHLTRKEKNRLFPAAYPLRIITQNIIYFA